MEEKIPDLSRVSSFSLEAENILLNGQKLLFDKKVKLMPVNVERKTDEG